MERMLTQIFKTSPWIRWLPAIVMMAAIFLFSATPSSRLPNFGSYDFTFKKAGHMLGYALLSVSYLYGIGRRRPKAFWLAWIFAVLYAMTDEYHQSFVPGRHPWVRDVGIDGIGAMIGLLFAYLKTRAGKSTFPGQSGRLLRKDRSQ